MVAPVEKHEQDREKASYLRAFGHVLRARRVAQGASQEDLSDRSKVERGYISYLENGEKEPGLMVIVRLCRGLEISVSEFIAEVISATHSEQHRRPRD